MRLFVYGSLKQGFHNAVYLSDARFLGIHATDADYSMYDFGTYPGVSIGGSTSIVGEIYEIDDQHLAATDRLEWYPDYYQRIVIETFHGDAWMYVIREELCEGKLLVPGVWS